MKSTKVKKEKFAVPMKVVRLIRNIEKDILEEPKIFDMSILARKISSCGTVACLAGWIAIKKMPNLKWQKYSSISKIPIQNCWDFARETLGLEAAAIWDSRPGFDFRPGFEPTKNGLCSDEELFQQQFWPEPFLQDMKTRNLRINQAN